MSITHRKSIGICNALLVLATSGCADVFLGVGNFLSSLGNGLNTVGTCLSPLTPTDLNAVLGKAPVLSWTDGVTEITDAPQPDVEAFMDEQIGQAVLPVDYLVMRFYQLGPLNQGEIIQVEPLSDVIDDIYLYDANCRLIYSGNMHDFEGRQQTLQMPILHDTASAYLRIGMEFLSERNESLARLTRRAEVAPAPRPQTVVLHFGGQEEVTFRNGYLIPAHVGAISDPAVRRVAVEEFRRVYSPFRLTVLTDDDPPPAEPYSVIFIGATELSISYFGLAEIIDSRNVYPDDIALVDTDQLVLQVAGALAPELFGRAIGMIAAHEMGHLLGLEHVADSSALMTGAQCQGSNGDIEGMLHRQLKSAPIIVFSSGLERWTIGYQDAVADLLETLGPATPQQ